MHAAVRLERADAEVDRADEYQTSTSVRVVGRHAVERASTAEKPVSIAACAPHGLVERPSTVMPASMRGIGTLNWLARPEYGRLDPQAEDRPGLPQAETRRSARKAS